MVVSCMWGLPFWTLLLIHMSDAGHAQIPVMIRLVSLFDVEGASSDMQVV